MMKTLPDLDPSTGYLPPGVHTCLLSEVHGLFVVNDERRILWTKFSHFLKYVQALGQFSKVYLGGGFISATPHPKDVDAILETSAPFGPKAFKAMEPLFAMGLDNLQARYDVHLHFWSKGFSGRMSDFRIFFQYLRPDQQQKNMSNASRKGIVIVDLRADINKRYLELSAT